MSHPLEISIRKPTAILNISAAHTADGFITRHRVEDTCAVLALFPPSPLSLSSPSPAQHSWFPQLNTPLSSPAKCQPAPAWLNPCQLLQTFSASRAQLGRVRQNNYWPLPLHHCLMLLMLRPGEKCDLAQVLHSSSSSRSISDHRGTARPPLGAAPDSWLEFQTKVKRMFAKISQSQKRPLLGPCPG